MNPSLWKLFKRRLAELFLTEEGRKTLMKSAVIGGGIGVIIGIFSVPPEVNMAFRTGAELASKAAAATILKTAWGTALASASVSPFVASLGQAVGDKLKLFLKKEERLEDLSDRIEHGRDRVVEEILGPGKQKTLETGIPKPVENSQPLSISSEEYEKARQVTAAYEKQTRDSSKIIQQIPEQKNAKFPDKAPKPDPQINPNSRKGM